MNIGLNFGAFFQRAVVGPTQAQVNQQASQGGGIETARDRVVKTNQQARAARLVGSAVATRKVLDKAGVTKVAGAKKG